MGSIRLVQAKNVDPDEHGPDIQPKGRIIIAVRPFGSVSQTPVLAPPISPASAAREAPGPASQEKPGYGLENERYEIEEETDGGQREATTSPEGSWLESDRGDRRPETAQEGIEGSKPWDGLDEAEALRCGVMGDKRAIATLVDWRCSAQREQALEDQGPTAEGLVELLCGLNERERARVLMRMVVAKRGWTWWMLVHETGRKGSELRRLVEPSRRRAQRIKGRMLVFDGRGNRAQVGGEGSKDQGRRVADGVGWF